jgi:hypothetical protein
MKTNCLKPSTINPQPSASSGLLNRAMLPRRAAGPRKRRLPIPQHEFGFAPEVFNLAGESLFRRAELRDALPSALAASIANHESKIVNPLAAQSGLFAINHQPSTINRP